MWVLVDGLPPDAATWRDDPAVFTRQDELLAVAIEEFGRWPRFALQAQGVKSHQLPDIRDVRPKPAAQLLTDPRDIASHLSRLMPRR